MKYLVICILLLIVSLILFAPLHITSVYNETMFSTVVGFKVQDWSVFIAFIVGIGSILAALYATEKNYNAIRLSSLPEKSVNLLIDLEFEFNEYKYDGDELKLLTNILKYWKDHQKTFRLLTPNFYKEFLKIINDVNYSKIIVENSDEKWVKDMGGTENQSDAIIEKYNENTDMYVNSNSEYILKAIITHITNIAFEKDNDDFSFIKPELIKDNIDIKNLGQDFENYTPFKISKIEVKDYIENICGKETQKLTSDKFLDFEIKLKKLLNELKKEIEEYD